MFAIEARDDVRILRMDDGKVNAMSPAWVAAFAGAWRGVESHPVVLSSSAKAFCAGLDLKIATQLPPDDLRRFAADFMRVFRDVLAHPRPVVAAVDGGAIAGGAVLALCADMRIAGPRARMGVVEVAVGVPFPGPVLSLARDRLPANEHPFALLEGGVREGADLVTRGWVDRATSAEALLGDAVALARKLGEHNPLAYADAKAQMTRALVHEFDAFDSAAWTKTWEHPDSRAALARTLERLARRS